MFTRREFLKTSSLIALAPSVPEFLANTARAAGERSAERVLVVLQLDGGNDGINTVVPFGDEAYARHRRDLRVASDRVLKIDDRVGLHPAMRAAFDLVQDGRLAIVQGVGYPNPNRSHDVSMGIWHTARFDREEHRGHGWLGRALDAREPVARGAPSALLVGNETMPMALSARKAVAAAMNDLSEYAQYDRGLRVADTASDGSDVAAFLRRSALDAHATAARLCELSGAKRQSASYGDSELARRLAVIATLIKGGFETPVYYALQPGYDTHYAQPDQHARLLRELSESLRAFLDDLRAARMDDRVVVLAFSEFGRRVAENASQGTDHGTAGPVLVAGNRVRAGLAGAPPSLADLDAEGDLKMAVDFRSVYATVLEDWLGVASRDVLAGSFERLALFKA